MKKSLKSTALALASAGLLSLSLIGTAQADVMASAVVNLTNFQLNKADGTQLDASDFSFLTFTSSADYSGDINGVGFSASSAATPVDFLANCTGSGCGAVLPLLQENTFAKLAPPALGNYAAADQQEAGAPITGIGALGSPATVANSAYAGLTSGEALASSASNNNLNSSLTFKLDQDGGISFSFDVDAFLLAQVTANENFPSFATAAYDISFSLVNLSAGGATVFNFSPDVFGDGTKTLSLNAPLPIDVTIFRSTVAPVSFSGATPDLVAGDLYQLSARITTEADVRRVPEPASLALIGLGLLGMGLARIRKQG